MLNKKVNAFPHAILRIFHTPHFPYSAFSTLRTFHTPHSALRTPHSAFSIQPYTCLFSDSNISGRVKRKPQKANLSSKERRDRNQTKHKKQLHERLEATKKHIKNVSNKELTNDEINLPAKGLKFIPIPVTKEIHIKRQPLRDFEQFARRMRLRYIYRGDEKEPYPTMLNKHGTHLYNAQSPPKLILKRLKYNLQKPLNSQSLKTICCPLNVRLS